MRKRHFIAAALGAASLPALAQGNSAKGLKGPALLTVTGAMVKGNRGPFDPVLDQMMGKQKLTFTKAHAFDFAALAALPAVTINPTLEYDRKQHKLSGPLWAVYEADKYPDMAAKLSAELDIDAPAAEADRRHRRPTTGRRRA